MRVLGQFVQGTPVRNVRNQMSAMSAIVTGTAGPTGGDAAQVGRTPQEDGGNAACCMP